MKAANMNIFDEFCHGKDWNFYFGKFPCDSRTF